MLQSKAALRVALTTEYGESPVADLLGTQRLMRGSHSVGIEMSTTSQQGVQSKGYISRGISEAIRN